MSILSRLWQYVHTNGYPQPQSEVALVRRPARNRQGNRNRYLSHFEEMEPRLMMTTLTQTAAQPDRTYLFFDFAKKNFTVTLHGNITVELYGTDGNGLVDLVPGVLPPGTQPTAGVDIFAAYVISSDINSWISITGSDVYTGGISSFFSNVTDSDSLPIKAPSGAGQVYIGAHFDSTVNEPITAINSGGIISLEADSLAHATSGFSNGQYMAGIYTADSIGRILVDGTVTGNVQVTGSIGTFYAGWLITGDASGGNSFSDPAPVDNNFLVTGDLGNLLVRTDIGTNVSTVATDASFYDAGTQIHVNGRIGTIMTGEATLASITADNNDVGSNSLFNLGYVWQEPGTYLVKNTQGARVGTFEGGILPVFSTGDPFFNTTFATAYYVGTLDQTNGAPSITLNGNLQGFKAPDTDDYYAFGVLTGQTITVTATAVGAQIGIFDPDGRLVYSAPTNVNGIASYTFTADRPGAYRVAVGLIGDNALSGNPPVFTDIGYSLSITGVNNMAIGAIRALGDVDSDATGTDIGITATTGDIGAIVADGNVISEIAPLTYNITAITGNILDVSGGSVGRIVNGFIAQWPTIFAGNTFGLITSSAALYSAIFATNDIQLINATTDLEGLYESDAGIGVVRAGTMMGESLSVALGQTAFIADFDDSGRDGIIDLIDVTGDMGTLKNGGPAIRTGTGGNVRYMHVGGSIYQDPYFGGGGTSTGGSAFGDGGIVHGAGESVTITDDSGSTITLKPAPAQTVTDPITGVVTVVAPGGQITTYTYGVEGTGGVVIVKIISNASLTITSSSGNGSDLQSAEIGEIDMTGNGAALTTTNIGGQVVTNPDGTITTIGGVNLPADDATALATTLNTLTIAGAILTDVFAVNGTGNVINRIINSTGGDIVTMNANDIGDMIVAGNIGATTSVSGVAINQTNNSFASLGATGAAYPLVGYTTGIVIGNAVTISAGKSIGHIAATGSVGTITANSDGVDDPSTFEGINGPIYVGGDVGGVNIGDGIGTSGQSGVSTLDAYGSSFSRGGLYVVGNLLRVNGTNADIRGDIISQTSIGSITLNNGSLVGAQIAVLTDLSQASLLFGGTRTLPIPGGSTINNPNYTIGSVSITGNGGILSTIFEASNIGDITVASTGFGVLNSEFITLGDGVLNSITAGGYGIRGVYFVGARVNSLNATGSGATADFSQYATSVRNSENNTIDPSTGQPVSVDNDLDLFMGVTGAGLGDLRTGVIGNSQFVGSQQLGNVTAFSLTGQQFETGINMFDFANHIGNIKITNDVTDAGILTGSLDSYTIGGDATLLNLQASGTIGKLLIAGNYVSGTIYGKGPSSNIVSLTVLGDFDGSLISNGVVKSLVIGTAGKKGSASSGDFNGTVRLLGGTSAKNLTFNAGFGGTFEIDGSVGTATFTRGLDASSTFIVDGNLSKLVVGSNKSINTGLAGAVIVHGNIGQVTGYGGMTGSITATATGSAPGSIGKISYTGDISGSINADGNIGAVKVKGNVTSTGAFVSTNGNLTSLTCGAFDGTLNFAAGNIGKIAVDSMGNNAQIIAGSIKSVTVKSDVNAATFAVAGVIGSFNVKGNLNGTQLTASNVSKLTVGNVTAGSMLRMTDASATSSMTVKGDVAGDILANGSIRALKAASLTNAVVTAGQNISSLTAKGAVTGSLVQAGITAGDDGIFGTADANEATSRGSISKMTVGNVSDSVIAAGGDIGTLKSGTFVDSSASAGLVMGESNVQSLISSGNALIGVSAVAALRTNPTLYYGNFNSVTVANGAEGGLDSQSALSAGVSPGPNGLFGDSSDLSIPPQEAGSSSFGNVKVGAGQLTQVYTQGLQPV